MSSAVYAIDDILRENWRTLKVQPSYTIQANPDTITSTFGPYLHPFNQDPDAMPFRFANVAIQRDPDLPDGVILLVVEKSCV